jgi:uncharacterized protein (DUF362 family)
MKNMFGVVPGGRYGWPKNILHCKGIQESILDLCATVPIHFVIADGLVAMEGNGPLSGTARPLGKIVLANDPVAADATCVRLMGFEPNRIVHIREGARFLGNSVPERLDQGWRNCRCSAKSLSGGSGVSTSSCTVTRADRKIGARSAVHNRQYAIEKRTMN